MTWHSHPTSSLSLPSISKQGRKYHWMDYHNSCHSPSHKPMLHHLLIALQRQLSTAYHYNFNHNATKAKPLYEVGAPPQATRNFRAYELNYNSCNKRRKQLLHKSKDSRTSRQSTQSCSNTLLPICRIQQTPPLHIRRCYPVASAVN